jgi:cell division protein FtsI/penicillin-binding protein 2
MNLNKKAAIKTAKITLGFSFLVLLFSIILANITIEVFLGVVFVLILGIFIRLIYQICLSDIEWEEKYKEREAMWQKIDEKRQAMLDDRQKSVKNNE